MTLLDIFRTTPVHSFVLFDAVAHVSLGQEPPPSLPIVRRCQCMVHDSFAAIGRGRGEGGRSWPKALCTETAPEILIFEKKKKNVLVTLPEQA